MSHFVLISAVPLLGWFRFLSLFLPGRAGLGSMGFVAVASMVGAFAPFFFIFFPKQ